MCQATASIDWNRLGELAADLRDKEGEAAKRLLAEFLRTAEEARPQLGALRAAGELAELKAGAHRLKSGAALLGLVRVTELCQEIESDCSVSRPPGLASRLRALETALEQVRSDLVDFERHWRAFGPGACGRPTQGK